MLTRLKIEGFKSIYRAQVELGTVNVFIGANGSGKSNLLEALGVLGAAAFGAVKPETLKERGVRPGVEALYKSSFEGRRKPRLIKLEAESEHGLYRLGLDNPIGRSRTVWGFATETLEDHGRTLLSRSRRGTNLGEGKGRVSIAPDKDKSAVALALQQTRNSEAADALVRELEGYGIYAPTTLVLRGLVGDPQPREPLGLAGGGTARAIRDLSQDKRKTTAVGFLEDEDFRTLVEWADDVDVVDAGNVPLSPAIDVGRLALRFTDRFMAKDRKTLSAYDASEGVLYVLFLNALASHPEAPRLFAVDNFDHAFHPRLAKNFIQLASDALLEDGTRQMLLTTHSPLLLDGLDLGDDRVRLFAVERARGVEKDENGEKRARGETFARRIELTPELLEMAKTEKAFSLSRLWVMGRLGAVPEDI